MIAKPLEWISLRDGDWVTIDRLYCVTAAAEFGYIAGTPNGFTEAKYSSPETAMEAVEFNRQVTIARLLSGEILGVLREYFEPFSDEGSKAMLKIVRYAQRDYDEY